MKPPLGTKHQLANNAAPASQMGFRIAGDGGHVVQNNVALRAFTFLIQAGFLVASDGNKLKNNRAQGHSVGIQVSGQRNAISGNHMSGNVSFGHEQDAVDTHLDCDENVWKSNLFHAASPSCVQ